jgi:hypothetical protein
MWLHFGRWIVCSLSLLATVLVLTMFVGHHCTRSEAASCWVATQPNRVQRQTTPACTANDVSANASCYSSNLNCSGFASVCQIKCGLCVPAPACTANDLSANASCYSGNLSCSGFASVCQIKCGLCTPAYLTGAPTSSPTAPTAAPVAVSTVAPTPASLTFTGTLTCSTNATGTTTTASPQNWYIFTAVQQGVFTFNACGSHYDTYAIPDCLPTAAQIISPPLATFCATLLLPHPHSLLAVCACAHVILPVCAQALHDRISHSRFLILSTIYTDVSPLAHMQVDPRLQPNGKQPRYRSWRADFDM